MSAAKISSELEVPIRTIYRDLEALLEAGFPLFNEKIETVSHWKLVEGFEANLPLPLTTTELMSLHMSRDILRVFEGTVFQESIESLFNKVKTS
ncbi:helix-turn-helix transcriptional regulator, partial [Thermodesulfobacteriota bacterium]